MPTQPRSALDRRSFLAALGALAACGRLARPAPAPDEARAFHAARRFVTTPQGRIAYVERGAGPAAVFLHGFPLNSFQWRGALARLAPYRRCVAPDFLGLGHTEVAEGQAVDPPAQVAMIVALLDALGIERFDLVANDSGGAIAQLLIARCPDRIRSVLLTNCDVEIDSPPPAMRPVIALAKQGAFVDRMIAPLWRSPARARTPEEIGGSCYADPANPTDEAIESYFAPMVASPRRIALVHAYTVALERNALEGVEYALACGRMPVRIVWGDADPIFARADAEYLARSVGNSRGVRWLAGSKLFWPEERPDVIAEEARQLWGV